MCVAAEGVVENFVAIYQGLWRLANFLVYRLSPLSPYHHTWSAIGQRMKLYTVYLFWLFRLQSSFSSLGTDQFSSLNVRETNPGFSGALNCYVIWYQCSEARRANCFPDGIFTPPPSCLEGAIKQKPKQGSLWYAHLPFQKHRLCWEEPLLHTGGHDEG